MKGLTIAFALLVGASFLIDLQLLASFNARNLTGFIGAGASAAVLIKLAPWTLAIGGAADLTAAVVHRLRSKA